MGFEWCFNSRFNSIDLLKEIQSEYTNAIITIRESLEGNIPFEDTDIENLICVEERDNLWYGCFLRFIDRSTFMKLMKSEDGLKIGSQSLEDLEKLVEVNFFMFNPKIMKGIYAYYHHSSWVDKFNFVARGLYEKINTREREKIKRKEKTNSITKKEANAKIKELKVLETNIITSPDNFEKLLENMAIVDKVSLSIKTNDIKDTGFTPLSNISRSAKIEFGISTSTSKADAIKNIIMESSKDIYRTITVKGKSSKDSPLSDLTAKLKKNYEYYAERDYLEIYRNVDFDIENLSTNLNPNNEVFKWLNYNLQRVK